MRGRGRGAPTARPRPGSKPAPQQWQCRILNPLGLLVYLLLTLPHTRPGAESLPFVFPRAKLKLHFAVSPRPAQSGWLSTCAHEPPATAPSCHHQECAQRAGHRVRGCVGEAHGARGLSMGQVGRPVGKASPAVHRQASCWSLHGGQQEPQFPSFLCVTLPAFSHPHTRQLMTPSSSRVRAHWASLAMAHPAGGARRSLTRFTFPVGPGKGRGHLTCRELCCLGGGSCQTLPLLLSNVCKPLFSFSSGVMEFHWKPGLPQRVSGLWAIT